MLLTIDALLTVYFSFVFVVLRLGIQAAVFAMFARRWPNKNMLFLFRGVYQYFMKPNVYCINP